jgi:hypothetical protein
MQEDPNANFMGNQPATAPVGFDTDLPSKGDLRTAFDSTAERDSAMRSIAGASVVDEVERPVPHHTTTMDGGV